MHRKFSRNFNCLVSPLLCMLLLAAGPAAAQKSHGAHVHGLVKVGVAVDGKTLSVEIEAPLDSLVGFESRPRSAAQRQAAQAALQQFQQPQWLRPDAAALCRLDSQDVQGEALQPAPAGAAPAAGKSEPHAELLATYRYTCAAPAQLAGLDITLAALFKRIERMDVQVAGAQRQGQQSLRGQATRVLLRR